MSAGAGPDRLGQRFYVITASPTGRAGDRHVATEAHLAWLKRLEVSGILFLAGPFVQEDGRSTGGGMFIVRAGSLAEAEELAAGDPYNAGGFRTYSVAPWRLDQGGFALSVSLAGQTVRFT
ncbi:MAG TPA: YciI family protein [Beijerinckiaceae bacterium]|nr:YciI family protein [Beijerinckiaceae bacterium]